MSNVLFVCSANLCRSVLAERLFNREVERLALKGWEARSAGLSARDGLAPPPAALSAFRQLGVEFGGHRPAALDGRRFNWADWVLVMEQAHVAALHSRFPSGRRKVRLLSEAAGLAPCDIADPGEGPAEGWATLVRDCIVRLARSIAGD